MNRTSTERIGITIVTGFLGSGKTTLVNRLLRDPALADTAIIVNEFGEIGIDHLLVKPIAADIMLLDSGCLCCAAGESLPDTLVDLWVRRERGEVPPFSRVIIETSGLAEPLPIAAVVLKHSMVSPRYRLTGIVTLVDCLFGPETLSGHSEAREQLALADAVILTKSDHPDARVAATCRAIADISPHADPATLSDDLSMLSDFLFGATESVLPPLSAETHRHATPALQRHWRAPEAVSWAGLAAFSQRVKSGTLPLLRCKGLVSVAGEAAPVLIQAVRTAIEIVRLDRWPDADETSRLICIFSAEPTGFDDLVAALAPRAGSIPSP